jgi:hypothetical protein
VYHVFVFFEAGECFPAVPVCRRAFFFMRKDAACSGKKSAKGKNRRG